MINLDPIRAAVAPYALLIKTGVALLCALVLFVGGCNHGSAKWQGKYDEEVRAREHDNIAWEAIVEGIAERTRKAAEDAKRASEMAKAERQTNDQRFKEKADEADKARADLAAALRNGSARLRPEWSCPSAGSAQGGTAADTGRQAGEAGLRRTREEAISDDIADHDRADNWITWLQSDLIATRKACGL